MRDVSRTVWTIASLVAMASSTSVAQTPAALPEPFVYLSEIDNRIQQDMRYAGGNNFLGRPVKGYTASQCILTRDTALALKKVQDALLKNNYSLKVYDCYRPAQGVKDFMTWSQDERDQKMKLQYYPEVDKRELFHRGFIATRSMHSRGNTVDLTIVPKESTVPAFDENSKLVACDKPVEQRLPDNSLDFGTGFDCFSTRSFTASSVIPQAAQQNRRMLVDAMAAQGFENYRKEWWHFEKKGAAMPDAYDFPIGMPPSPQTVKETAATPPTPDPGSMVPPAPVQVRRACPLTEDASGLFSVDCNGKNIEITVLADLASRAPAGRIKDYEPGSVSDCKCQVLREGPEQGQEWCKINYVKTVGQEFKGWVPFAALQNPLEGRPPNCQRSAAVRTGAP